MTIVLDMDGKEIERFNDHVDLSTTPGERLCYEKNNKKSPVYYVMGVDHSYDKGGLKSTIHVRLASELEARAND
jgi:hypothetical protein